MPIRKLATRGAAFPRIGELRKGAPKPESGPGKDLGQFFRFTSDDPAVAEEFKREYGDQPTVIPIFFPYRTAAENFDTWMEHWVAGGLKHRCDGETMVLWQDEKGQYRTEPKPCTGGCKQVGRLTVVIPALHRLASVTVLTTSINDIVNLTENLEAFESLRGDLRGIPFILCRKRKLVSTPGAQGGKRQRREKWLLAIQPVQQWVEWQLAAQEKAATPMLTAGGVLVDSTTGVVLLEGVGAPAPDFGEGENGIEDGELVEPPTEEPPEQPPEVEEPKAEPPAEFPKYGNGAAVSDNQFERQTFKEYADATGHVPANVDILRQWVKIERLKLAGKKA